MPKVITISDEAYEKLKRIKGNRSFSETILSLLKERKKITKAELIKWIEKQEKLVKRKENVSERIDEILYGAK